MNAHATLGVPFRNVNAGNGSRFVHLLCVPRSHPARRAMWIYRPVQPRRCGTKEQVLWRIPSEWESAVSSPHPHPVLAFPMFPHMLCTPPAPQTSDRGCSIPAGPCLFISSETAMINETLNTSSLSPGPGEPHSWVNSPASVLPRRPRSWALSHLDGEPRFHPTAAAPTSGRNSCHLSGLLPTFRYHDARLL